MSLYELFGSKREYLKGKKGLIFDMDGTLIDSMSYWRLTAGDDISEYQSLEYYVYDKYNTTVEAKPYAKELLQFLKENGVTVCIATDTPRIMSENFLKRSGFDSLIDVYIGSDDVGAYKQNSSAIYDRAATILGCTREECLVFEDVLSSVSSAHNGGYDVVGVYDKESAKNEKIIRSMCVDYIYDFSGFLSDAKNNRE